MAKRPYRQRLRAESASETRARNLDALYDRLREAPSEPISVDGTEVDAEWTTGINLRVPLPDLEPGRTARLRIPFTSVLLTGDTAAECRDLAAQHGITVLHKPVTPAALRSVLADAEKTLPATVVPA